MSEFEEGERQFYLFCVQAAALISLFIAAMSVLDALIGLMSFWAFVADRLDPAKNPEWHEALARRNESPAFFILLNVYNVILWNLVIVCAIWLMRGYGWTLRWLRRLLEIDMMVTMINLLGPWALYLTFGSQKPLPIFEPGWYITFNALQIGAIIILSYPAINKAVNEPACHEAG
ncbi:MAG: hypothetical protein GC154_18205 [bacterium]|nr:hypothetical protein [bacterium]